MAEVNDAQSRASDDAASDDAASDDAALARLRDVMAALRAPDTGCPWDLEQTFATIAPYTIEEAYEVADAIARADMADLRDELGDLLLQVVYHSRMAEEAGAFALPDVIWAITAKMIRRHPHVFGDRVARSSGMAKGWWEDVKAEEEAERKILRQGLSESDPQSFRAGSLGRAGASEGGELGSVLDGVPVALPGLARAVKLQTRAARVGFDWPSLGPVLAKLREELAEFEEVMLPLDPRSEGFERAPLEAERGRAADELGDLLFVVANVARHLNIDPDAALRATNEKFERRFRHIERRLAEQGRNPATSDLAEMDVLWNEAKVAERETARSDLQKEVLE